MRILIFDNDLSTIEKLKKNIIKSFSYANVSTYDDLKDCFVYIKDNSLDILIVSIDSKSEKDIIDLVNKAKKKNDNLNIIFMSKDNSFKALAFDIKASGYLLKPVENKALNKELNDLRYEIKNKQKLLRIQCFGNFSVFSSEGQFIRFSRSKAKELFAYLIYKQGTDVNTKELAATLFPDQDDDKKQVSYIHQLLFSLNNDLKAYGANNILIRGYNSISVDTSLLDCDYYRFNNNDEVAKRQYTGEFMMQYEWAEYVTAYLDRHYNGL